jgi:hypothetical protein
MLSKKILLAGIAAGALAMAGSAGAATISSAKVSNKALAVANGATTTFYTLANESVAGTANANLKTSANAGDNTVAAGLTAANPYFAPGATGTTYSVTYTLTGATFTTALGATSVAVTGAGATCATSIGTPTIVSGGGAGQSSVTFNFTVPASCSVTAAQNSTSPTGVTVDAPFTVATTATSVSANFAYQVINGASAGAFDGAGATAQLVARANLYSVVASSSPASTATITPTQFALPSYKALVANGNGYDNIIGSYYAGLATAPASSFGSTVFPDMGGVSTAPALTYNAAITATSGNYSILTPVVWSGGSAAQNDTDAAPAAAAPALALNTAKTVAATATPAAALTAPASVQVTVANGNTTSFTGPVASTIAVTPILAANTLVATPSAASATLETVTLQGTNLYVAWMNDGVTAGSGTQSIIRIGNIGSSTPVTATVNLLNATGTVTAPTNSCNVFTLPAQSSGGELTISSSQLQACFGNFGRADATVTLPTSSANITAKERLINLSSGLFIENSLGTGQAVATQ